ncbi:MAG: adenylyltransferase/cytidyltransferase family protein, partial [Micavibrio sp.]
MDVYTSISQLPPDAQGAVIAVGNFDGVHKGHQAVIKAAKDKADAGGLPFGVLTFEPHPRRLFRPDDPPFRITSPSLKWERLKECGAGFTLSLPFDWDFASQSAGDFITSILKNGLRPAHIFAGEDFRFGQLRKGSLDTVRKAGIPASGIKPVTNQEDALYSSTSIRQLLRSGEIAAANALLGWEWYVDGAIVRGDRRGHELGY